jgi:hypothetical protein
LFSLERVMKVGIREAAGALTAVQARSLRLAPQRLTNSSDIGDKQKGISVVILQTLNPLQQIGLIHGEFSFFLESPRQV